MVTWFRFKEIVRGSSACRLSEILFWSSNVRAYVWQLWGLGACTIMSDNYNVHAIIVARNSFSSAVRFQRVSQLVIYSNYSLTCTIGLRQSGLQPLVLLAPHVTAPVHFCLLLVCSNYFSTPFVAASLYALFRSKNVKYKFFINHLHGILNVVKK